MKADIAIIGGTGLYNMDMMEAVSEITVETEYGEAKAYIGSMEGKSMAFMPRHGTRHSVPPHLVNYRANITALKQLGVKKILATASVGSLNTAMAPGHLVLVDQFIDFTKNRPLTFFEGGEKGVVHTDVTQPYCIGLRGILKNVSRGLGRTVHQQGVYVCTEGPRFETPAEIKMFQLLGGHLVGMTNVPEVVLAREAGLCYATVATVTNFAAGISPNSLSHEEVLEEMAASQEYLLELLRRAVRKIVPEEGCGCSRGV